MDDNKKLVSVILLVTLIGIVLVIGIFILATMQTGLRTFNTAGTAVNESIDKPTTAGISLASASLVDGSCGTVTSIYNGTGGIEIGLGNITQTGCTVVNATATTTYGATWLISYPYSYSADSAASNASGNSVTALTTGTPWLTIILVVAFAMIVIGFLSNGFRDSAKEQLQY